MKVQEEKPSGLLAPELLQPVVDVVSLVNSLMVETVVQNALAADVIVQVVAEGLMKFAVAEKLEVRDGSVVEGYVIFAAKQVSLPVVYMKVLEVVVFLVR